MARARRSLQNDPWFGLDSHWSWVMVGFLSWLLTAATVSQQAVAIFFYAIVYTYGASREEASWPLILSASFCSMSGPFLGYVCRRFSCQAVLLVCTLAAGFSILACSFIDSIVLLAFLFGVVHGISLGGIYVAVNVLVSQHFEKRRATACSIIFFSVGLNALFVPPLAEFFRFTYGVRGTFLLLAGMTLNAFPAAIVTRSPVWLACRPILSKGQPDGSLLRPAAKAEHGVLLPSDQRRENDNRIDEPSPHHVNVQDLSSSSTCPNTSFIKKVALRTRPRKPTRLHDNLRRCFASEMRQFWTLPFAVTAFSFVVIRFGAGSFQLLSVDIATDKGIAPHEAVFLLNAFALGDIVFRPISGLIIDSGLLSLDGVMMLGFLLQCISYELLAWHQTFSLLLACSVLAGISNGLRTSLQAPALVKDFDVESLPMLIGGVVFCSGLIQLTRPFLVGYCRDHHGSYDLLLHIIAGASVAMLAMWYIKYHTRNRQPR